MNGASTSGRGWFVGLGSLVAPALALVGLVIVAIATLALLGGDVGIGLPSGNGGPEAPPPGVARTPAPSNVVIADPRPTLAGSLVYAKAGNVWIQRSDSVVQVTDSGTASMPAWAPDGRSIVYVETTEARGLFRSQGRDRHYRMEVPRLMRINADGSGTPEMLLDGAYVDGRYRWFSWLRQPAVSPDGRTIALVSDAPVPTESDVVLQLLDVATGELTKPNLIQTPPLGHQDPVWRPDGRTILFTRNDRDGTRGAPLLTRLTLETGRSGKVAGPGYSLPDFSPDGRHVVATKTGSLGTDIVILDASSGAEVARLTSDGRSWAPAWSPAGNAIVFLHIESGIVDLRMMDLAGAASRWTPGEVVQLTHVSGLDAASRPDWYVPPEQLPAPTDPPPTSPSATVPGAAPR